MIRSISIYIKHDFDEIPDEPKASNVWMLNSELALWFSIWDKRWRFMLFTEEPTRRSMESFATKFEAMQFYQARKMPTWTRKPLEEKRGNC